MPTIKVNVSTPYNVIISKNLINSTAELIADLPNQNYKRIAIISDSNVAPLYEKSIHNSFKNYAELEIFSYVFPAGESSKSIDNAMELINWLCKNSFTRSDALIALGGGVCGDLVGFVASIYLRGCDFIQIPTTLLAAIDSSVGGKTAINIPYGKNLVGSFWQPRLVICDTDTFATLSSDIFSDGVAEAIKYGCIWDKALFDTFSTKTWINDDIGKIIARCVEIKADIVSSDEKDYGLRQILNFGHTVGHAIEKLSKLSISHGKGVAVGMSIVVKSQEISGQLPNGTFDKVKAMLELYDLPSSTEFTAKDLAKACLSDKKRSADSVNLITLKDIGAYSIAKINISDLEEFIKRGI